MESEVEVKYWIGGTTGETGFHSILFVYFYPRGDPGRIADTSTLSQFFRSGGKSEYQGLLTFRIQYKVFKGGRKFILVRLYVGEYLALASLSISDGT